LLGSEYGWAFTEILERVYFDDLFYLMKEINKRKLREYKMQAALIQNPHTKDPKELWRIFEAEEGIKNEEFDAVGFERLKNKLRSSSKFIVK